MSMPGNGGATRVAGSIVDALKSSPLLLVLLIFNAVFIVAVFYNSRDQRHQQNEMAKHLVENQQRMQELLLRCIPQPK
jgi:high-affinity nickel permease